MNFVIEKNLMVPMRDGVKLAADLYRPAEGGPFPSLLIRLPYSKETSSFVASPGGDVLKLAGAGYAVLVQDVRGTGASEGDKFVPVLVEPEDGADTVAWITKQPWSTGKVGIFGPSYLGFVQWLMAKEQPEGLVAMAPTITTSNFYHAPYYQGGAFNLGSRVWWALFMGFLETMRQLYKGKASMAQMGQIMQAMGNIQALYERMPLTDVPEIKEAAPYYFDWLNHPTYDEYWQKIAPDEHYEQVTVPALNIGGWYDLYQWATIENYVGMKARGGSETARRHQRLIIGPWSHTINGGAFPEREYGFAASMLAADITGAHIRWFDHWLKGVENGVEQDKPVKIFVMGLDQWREEEDWPLPDTQYRNYYLRSGGKANRATGDGSLSTEAPGGAEAEDIYLYDPRRPVPTKGGPLLFGNVLGTDAGPLDQRQIEERDDVLCYTTPVLEKGVEVTGPVELVLYISSSAKDTDFTGKLVDVYPNGRAEILCDGILRARYRDSFSKPKLLEPGQIYELHLSLWATSNLFKPGHRIRLEVSSSNFPRFDRNTNTGGTIAIETEKDFAQAINRVYHDKAHPSHLILPVIERG